MIGQMASEIFKFESVDEDDDGRRRKDDGPLVYYKLTLWAFGSGELKKRGSVEYVISERGKKNSKTCDSERYQFNQLNFFKMLQNNLNLEYVENNIIAQQTHLTAKYEFC